MKKIIVHVGYPKTATTTLQTEVFSKHSGMLYFTSKPEAYDEVHWMGERDNLWYDPEPLHKLVAEARSEAGDRTIVVSEERLFAPSATEWEVVSDRIRKSFSPCKVMITLREQIGLVKSFFCNHARTGEHVFSNGSKRYPITMEQWMKMCFRFPSSNLPHFLDYHTVLTHYAEVFGRENVGVFLFEEMIADKNAYFEKMAEFMEVDPREFLELYERSRRLNTRVTNRRCFYESVVFVPLNKVLSTLRIGRFIPGKDAVKKALFDYLDRGSVLDVEIPQDRLDSLLALYAEGNRKLNDEWGLRLEENGYHCAPKQDGANA